MSSRSSRHPLLYTASMCMVLLAGLVVLCGCRSATRVRHTTSIVDYLYPNRSDVVVEPAIPVLTLPLKVGVAFVPSSSRQYGPSVLDERQRMSLIDRISAEFRKYPFVKSIETIPSAYLAAGGSFDNLDQIRTMHGIDVIALLSYDQIQHTDEGLSSILYWTLVGAYVVKGERNSTSTMIDAAVYDIASRKMLFRAPGTSHVRGGSTPVELSKKLREDSATGFRMAADDLSVNLQDQLQRFRERIKQAPEEVKIVANEEYRQRGGGAGGRWWAVLVLALCGLGFALDRSRGRLG